jgi:hypothetical protein
MTASFVLPFSIGAARASGRRAIVVGGSMAGLFEALLLRRAGWIVEINERAGSELLGRGTGIVTHAELFDLLRSAGIEVRLADLGVCVPGRRVLDMTGRILGELSLEQILTSWDTFAAFSDRRCPRESIVTARTFCASGRWTMLLPHISMTVRAQPESFLWGQTASFQPFAPGSCPVSDLPTRATWPGGGWWKRRSYRFGRRRRFVIGSHSACRRENRCLAIPWPAPMRIWRPGAGASTSSGTGRRRRMGGCQSSLRTSTGFVTNSQSHQAKSGSEFSRKCAETPNAFSRYER